MQRRYLNLLLIGLIALGSGCQEPDEIRQYRIPKSRSDLGEIGTKKLPVAAGPPRSNKIVDSRMVVAISQRSDATWFFKVTGPTEAVNKTENEWQSIVKSVTFDDNGKPDWTLPDGWKLGPPKTMRYATLLTSSAESDRVEISISSLGPNQNLLDNVNRWRDQLGLKAVEQDELKLSNLSGESGEFKIFDAVGKMAIGSSMASSSAPRPPMQPDLKYDVGEGWIEGRQSMMVPVRLRYGTEKSAPQITVTQLLAAANEWLPNAQRWANQVGVPQDEETLVGLTDEINVDSLSGQRVRLIPADEESKFAIVGAMVVRDDIAWFFKFIGEKKFIEDNQEMFDQFLASFKFGQN